MKTELKIKKWHLEICKQVKKTLSNAVFGYSLCLVLSVQFMDICQFHFLNISTLNFDAKAIVHILLPISWNNHFDCHLLVKIFSVSLSATKIVLILQSAIQGLPQFSPTFLFDLIPPLPTAYIYFDGKYFSRPSSKASTPKQCSLIPQPLRDLSLLRMPLTHNLYCSYKGYYFALYMCTQQFFTTVSEAPQEWDQCLIPFCGPQFVHTGLSKYLMNE